ncbi:hypothetical protein DPMN_119636 [Dreissena polymorpha]|uniref:Uncharacterized protein n=1 Tax=Dreissena polymorpha TaxID=45954 RepID=A0A9D4GJJ2_DREPO|nr:hypothetical protein DPMN_119636 [Dreissena polymorpha]
MHVTYSVCFHSRDTTVKIWCMDSLRELKSLGGHTGSVTDVLVKPYKEVPNLGRLL